MSDQTGKLIADQLTAVRARVAAACTRARREISSVRVLAASKSIAQEQIIHAINAGQQLFGENYVQEARQKYQELEESVRNKVELHFIGHLQKNKVKQALSTFKVIQTVDSRELANAIASAAIKEDIVKRVMVQVNVSGEDTKSGVLVEGVRELCQTILQMPGLRLEGLMSIGSLFTPDCEEISQKEFKTMRELKEDLELSLGIELPALSMGMSHDFELAIEEGATIIRVGTGIFGPRPKL